MSHNFFFYFIKNTNGKLSNNDTCGVYIIVNIQDFTNKRLRDPIQFQKLQHSQSEQPAAAEVNLADCPATNVFCTCMLKIATIL